MLRDWLRRYRVSGHAACRLRTRRPRPIAASIGALEPRVLLAAPTNITLSNNIIAENQPIGTAIGNLSTTDADPGDTFTYQLVTGTGSTDNANFAIVGTQLQTSASFDFETKSSYSIRVRTTDSTNATFEKQFSIGIANVDDTPPTVTTASFVSSGTLAANATSLTVTFNEVAPQLGSQYNPAFSARQILNAGASLGDGIYWIDPDGAGGGAAFQVYCDMTTNGGGWMLAVNSVIGSESVSNDLTANTGTVGLGSGHTRDLDTIADSSAQIRHEINAANLSQGFFHGKYTGTFHGTFPASGAFTFLSGHTNTNLLANEFGKPFSQLVLGATWYNSGNPFTAVPSTPSAGPIGPAINNNAANVINSYRIWVRETTTPAVQPIVGANIAGNYQLQRAGTDGLLGTADHPTASPFARGTRADALIAQRLATDFAVAHVVRIHAVATAFTVR